LYASFVFVYMSHLCTYIGLICMPLLCLFICLICVCIYVSFVCLFCVCLCLICVCIYVSFVCMFTSLPNLRKGQRDMFLYTKETCAYIHKRDLHTRTNECSGNSHVYTSICRSYRPKRHVYAQKRPTYIYTKEPTIDVRIFSIFARLYMCI